MKKFFFSAQANGVFGSSIVVDKSLLEGTVVKDYKILDADTLEAVMLDFNADEGYGIVYQAIESGRSFSFIHDEQWIEEEVARLLQLCLETEVYSMHQRSKSEKSMEWMEKQTICTAVWDALTDAFYDGVNLDPFAVAEEASEAEDLAPWEEGVLLLESCDGFKAGSAAYFVSSAEGAVKTMVIDRLEMRRQDEVVAIGFVDGMLEEKSLAFLYHNETQAQHNAQKVVEFMAKDIVNQAVEATQNQANNTKEMVSMIKNVNVFGSSLTAEQVVEMMAAQGFTIFGTAFHKKFGEIVISGFEADQYGVKIVASVDTKGEGNEDDIEEKKFQADGGYIQATPFQAAQAAPQVQPKKKSEEGASLNEQLRALAPKVETVAAPVQEEAMVVDEKRQAQIEAAKATANSGAAQAILSQFSKAAQAPQANQGGGAAQAPQQPQRQQGNGMGNGGARSNVGQQSQAQQQNNQNQGGNNMNNTQPQARQSVGQGMGNGSTVRVNIGESAGVAPTNTSMRIDFEQFNARQQNFDTAWYHNTEWYPSVIAADVFEANGRKNEALGITGMTWVNPSDRMQNPGNTAAVIDVKIGAVTIPFRIQMSNDESKSDKVYSPNIGGKKGPNGYSRFYKTTKVEGEGTERKYIDVLLPYGFRIEQDLFAQVMSFAHWAMGFEI